ncbi:MAG TPA: hypothetical protein PLK31_02870 [Chloroflexota bacterium]|nr:hypothetical protein [Chloroflexota bacterium]
MKRYWFTLLALLLLLLAACGGSETTTPTDGSETGDSSQTGVTPVVEPAGPAIVRIGWGGSPDTLNPGAAVLSEAYTLFELVYDAMYQLQLDGSYTLELAESVDVSDDGTVYTYTPSCSSRWCATGRTRR